MRHFIHRPEPPLGDFVDCFWLILGGEALRKERVLPSGTSELVINLHEDEVRIHDFSQPAHYIRYSGGVVSGAHSRPFVCDALQHRSLLGVHFKPGGAFPFFGVPACELTEAHVDLADLWGREGPNLRDRLCAAQSPGKQFQVVERALLDRFRRASKLHPAIPMALDLFGPAGGGSAVRDVARNVGFSQRRFIQIFRTQVGLTPKLLCRILRFQRARVVAKQREQRPFSYAGSPQRRSVVDWAGVASACGYYDQAHLINDFKEFSGVSPAEYVQRQSLHGRLKDNHVPLVE